ncbi:hypothetical protein A2U01_0014414, partial [Trifolium medium]|nr:hypothetical protein [Trifolium medium]
ILKLRILLLKIGSCSPCSELASFGEEFR